jgi:hypothetical protein
MAASQGLFDGYGAVVVIGVEEEDSEQHEGGDHNECG